MYRIHSLQPIIDQQSRILILGSIPGKDSLHRQQYYAHPRNAFWPIILKFLGNTPDITYDKRCNLLLANSIAIWDVIGSCVRPTSLDTDINEQSICINDFHQLFADHPAITHILFNGGKAEQSFVHYVQPKLQETAQVQHRQRLPSTSPANAGLSFATKLAIWSEALRWAHCSN